MRVRECYFRMKSMLIGVRSPICQGFQGWRGVWFG